MENQESVYLLKMVQQVHEKGEPNGTKDGNDYIGVGDDHTMTFDIKEVIHLTLEGVVFNTREKQQNGNDLQLSASVTGADNFIQVVIQGFVPTLIYLAIWLSASEIFNDGSHRSNLTLTSLSNNPGAHGINFKPMSKNLV